MFCFIAWEAPSNKVSNMKVEKTSTVFPKSWSRTDDCNTETSTRSQNNREQYQIVSNVVAEDLVAKRLEFDPRQFPGRLVLNLELAHYLASRGAANPLYMLERIRQLLIIRNLRVPDTNSPNALLAKPQDASGFPTKSRQAFIFSAQKAKPHSSDQVSPPPNTISPSQKSKL